MKSYVIYELESTYLVRIMRNGYWCDASYKSEGAAKAAFNRMAAEGKVALETHGIAESDYFHASIEKKVIKHNLMSGKPFEIAVNEPASCDPSTETYWSM